MRNAYLPHNEIWKQDFWKVDVEVASDFRTYLSILSILFIENSMLLTMHLGDL